jgi:LmbE family N-acetylglucosaminyl deacetylase
LTGDILVVAPHMDDETLGCGMLIAEHGQRFAAHVLFATDGARSPEPSAGTPMQGLPSVRAMEAERALAALGVPRERIAFLGLPAGALARHAAALRLALVEHVRALSPAYVLVPFRYDRHPDHLAVNRAATAARCAGSLGDARVVEYFVYTQWRLLATGDVRDYLPADDVVRFHTPAASERKRAALACYGSQTTRYFEWQARPILTGSLIERVCTEPETFLFHRPERGGRRGLARGRAWVPLACRLEPPRKRFKDRLAERRAK